MLEQGVVVQDFGDDVRGVDVWRDPADDPVVFQCGTERHLIVADDDERRDGHENRVLALGLDDDVTSFNSELGAEVVLEEQGSRGARDGAPEQGARDPLFCDSLDAQAEQDHFLLTLNGLHDLRVARFDVHPGLWHQHPGEHHAPDGQRTNQHTSNCDQ